MVKFLDGATGSHWVGLSDTFILLWLPSRAWLEKLFNVFLTVIKVLIVFKLFAPCLKSEAVNQLTANFIYWKATCVSQDYTHRFAVCAHFERHLPPSLWIMVLKSVQSTLSHLITTSVPRATFTRFLFIVNRFKVHSLSSGKGEMFPCAACHAFMPHVNERKN